MSPLQTADPEIYAACAGELRREQHGIELIASENFTSRAVLEAQGTCLTNKYAEGYPGKRYYGGCEEVDKVERLAIDRVKDLFGADHANVQPHSGSQANMAAYLALCPPGAKLLGMDLAHGGHLTHGYKINFSGRIFHCAGYGVDPQTERIDYAALEKTAKEFQPQIIVAGASAYPRVIDFAKFADIAKAVGAYLVTDMAHIAGLVATGAHPSPLPYSDIVTSTTHKTLRGPRGGLILCKSEFAAKVDSAVFPGMQGGPLCHVVAGKAVAFKEAATPEFKRYTQNVVANARVLAEEFLRRGYRLVSGGTDNHLMLIDVTPKNLTGKEAETLLAQVEITVNKNQIPFDKLPPLKSSGIRIGTPAITTRGFDQTAMKEVAAIIDAALVSGGDEKQLAALRARTQALTEQFPLYA
ncbi:serine hydroxymethyltransferase [Planctomycetales bacterium]|nr:serine hydroxymethyltransferase [Planctomycetales bacterium]GHT00046.1 serine hydroxymethyltransferase [Planctomycetales bacterium]GHT07121.1 serine hydroxymethyltransferase [Planctomycetales bacterium]